MDTRNAYLGIVVFALCGCAATRLNPGAERIMVTRQPAPQGCTFVGTVIGQQGGAATGVYTSNKNLAEGAMNDMKNKAQAMGANYVVLEDTSHGNTLSGSGNSVSAQQTDVTHTGNAFQCPVYAPPPPMAMPVAPPPAAPGQAAAQAPAPPGAAPAR